MEKKRIHGPDPGLASQIKHGAGMFHSGLEPRHRQEKGVPPTGGEVRAYRSLVSVAVSLPRAATQHARRLGCDVDST